MSNGSDTMSQINETATNQAGSSAATGSTAVNAAASTVRFFRRATRPRLDTAVSTLSE